MLGALGDWGREHLRSETDAGVRYHDAAGRPVRVSFVDEDGRVLDDREVEVSRR